MLFTNKQTDRQTNPGKNITSLVEVILIMIIIIEIAINKDRVREYENIGLCHFDLCKYLLICSTEPGSQYHIYHYFVVKFKTQIKSMTNELKLTESKIWLGMVNMTCLYQ